MKTRIKEGEMKGNRRCCSVFRDLFQASARSPQILISQPRPVPLITADVITIPLL